MISIYTACKCDLRDDRAVKERLARIGYHTVQYEEGLAVARRIRASRYLGTYPGIQFDAEWWLNASSYESGLAADMQNVAQNRIAGSRKPSTKQPASH